MKRNPEFKPGSEAEVPQSTADISGPSWNNTPEYPSISSNEFARDLVLVDQLIHQLQKLAENLQSTQTKEDELIIALQNNCELEEQALTLLNNLLTYVECERSIDGSNAEAIRVQAMLMDRRALLRSAATFAHLILIRLPEDSLQRYLSHKHASAHSFALREERKQAATRLSESEETLLEQMRTHAIDSWGNLYDQISGNLRCTMEGADRRPQTVGLAQAAGLLRDGAEGQRRSAWYGIQAAWATHEESCAAILNGLAGWRIEEYRRRSRHLTKPIDFLDFPIHEGRIQRATLEALMTAVEDSRAIGQRAMRAMARGFGKVALDPWDLTAPAPSIGGASAAPQRRSFKEGLKIVREAFGSIDPTMADFVDTMEKNRWIEGRVLPTKQPGAYCTQFSKSRTPRVFQTYMGSLSDIRTLAHELGHAYHAWVTRDLPSAQQQYPMTLAETASIFAETAFAQSYYSAQVASQLEISWQNAEAAAGFLLNIPARFDFEKSFYERRQEASYVTHRELGDLTEAAWRKWYGDTLTQTERQYWMTKLHFSLSRISFYNFPYTFGYLFSLGVFALRDKLGGDFFPMYKNLLRDSGRMTAEELTLHYLGEDLNRPEFWLRSLAIVEKQVARFEELVANLKPSSNSIA